MVRQASKALVAIRVRGARQNNLKNIDLDLPLNRFTVITGVSGSGKSSLAFDTLYAEGQRRYVETFSPYARQFMDRMDRPKVDVIDGVPPAIAIDRKAPVRTSRSTVGTMTELTDYVKLLCSRRGILHCRQCGAAVLPESPDHIWQSLSDLKAGSTVVITYPYAVNGQGLDKLRRNLGRMGFDRHWRNGRVQDIDTLDPDQIPETLHILADRLKFSPSDRQRVVDSLEQAFRFGGGQLSVWLSGGRQHTFSQELSCARCGIPYPPAPPNLFSFNSPVGACETCRGFGRVIGIDLDLIIPDPERSLAAGAIKPWGQPPNARDEYHDLIAFCRRRGIDTEMPFKELPPDDRSAVIDGCDDFYGVRRFFRYLERKTYKMHVRVFLSRYRSYDICPDCQGSRFRPAALDYRIDGRTIADIYEMDVDAAASFFGRQRQTNAGPADEMVLTEIRSRLGFLIDVGLGYLTLGRQSRTLSGGEVQRVALASALGTSLVNTLYVLDEPSIGLHPRDTQRLIGILKGLRDNNNTVVVVEHDPQIIRSSDFMIDMGPRAGEQGGQVMFFGRTSTAADSLTAQYLRGVQKVKLPPRHDNSRRENQLVIRGAAQHNLQQIDVTIPLERFVCLTGVSGSGKSTLAETILYRALKRYHNDPKGRPGKHAAIEGMAQIKAVDLIDQRAIGRTPRANLLTYCGAMDPVRQLLASSPDARAQGFDAGYFSFNVDRGRCPVCKGDGFEKIEMQFLSDVFVTCPACAGKRFRPEVLSVRTDGRTIYDILQMTVAEGLVFFKAQPSIVGALTPLAAVGLDYIRLGQPISTLSGGEAQRLKLSRFLGPKTGGRRLFIFDEPTTGLHFDDIQRLLEALRRLVDNGHSALVIEHNIDVIAAADWIIDLGPEGGPKGGQVVACGPPEIVARNDASHTGRFIKSQLAPATARPEPPLEISEPRQTFELASQIHIDGGREHNLKNISLRIPRDLLVVLTGVSGSGKSSLAFDILFAEGQRRYLESLTPYVRQFVTVLERPEVDRVTGLPPSVAIEQRISHSGRRSTVATLTEIYHYLRLLFSKLGTRHCLGCGRPLASQSREDIVAEVVERYGGRNGILLAPVVYARKGYHRDLLQKAYDKGYRRARIDGRMTRIAPGMALSRYHDHTIALQVARLSEQNKPRTAQWVEKALAEGDGALIVRQGGQHERLLSIHGHCPACGKGLESNDPRLFAFNSSHGACPACDGLGIVKTDDDQQRTCDTCHGSRLRAEALSVTISGQTIWDMVQCPVDQLQRIVSGLRFDARQSPVAEPIMAELDSRLSLLSKLGLSYLALSRSGDTLSGGEAQRLRLAAQLGSNLTGVLYILDEPTIGLHPRDSQRLLDALTTLRDRGNSILVVEHDEETIRAADHLIDMGPKAGAGGGRVVAQGTLADLEEVESPTAIALKNRSRQLRSRQRPYRKGPHLAISGANANNLKNIDARIPLGRLVCLTGVSGSGKSSLLDTTIYRGLRARLGRHRKPLAQGLEIRGTSHIQRVLKVDHSPIGRTPRSTPASYVGFLDEIRRLFARTPAARARGYRPGRFSFNVAGGRCESCKGQGIPKVAMSFLPDVYVPCDTCRGKRFNRETLAVTYRGKSIADVLEMTFAEAADFFDAIPAVRRAVSFVDAIGLGYVRLGQPSPTLSGGEAQRIKLAEQMARPGRGHTLYILDEPTTGLHQTDVRRLIDVIQNLIDAGNSVAAIEHNLEFISAADYIIDMGPEGGTKGGRIVAKGSPKEVLRSTRKSHTARHLKAWLSAP